MEVKIYKKNIIFKNLFDQKSVLIFFFNIFL